MEQKHKKRFYVELDALFDTRITMLSAILEHGKKSCGMSLETYMLRTRDNFGTISDKIFHMFYKQRNKNALKDATLTYVPELIKDHIKELMVLDAENKLELNIDVNLYPYILNKTEVNAMYDLLTKVFPHFKINFIYVNLHETHLSFVAERYYAMAMYDALGWLEIKQQSNQIINNPIVDIAVYTPWLVKGIVPTTDLAKDDREYEKNVTLLYKTLIDLKFVPSNVFCFRVSKSEKTLETIDKQMESFGWRLEKDYLNTEKDNNKMK